MKKLAMVLLFLLPLMNPVVLPHKNDEEWCFAIITDLHIGRGYPNYTGENYYLTERLEKVVKWINQNNKIKFVAVLGDIADSGEYSEMKKAKEILDKLHVPYFPVIGNHDVWFGKEKPIGENFFKKVFNEGFIKDQLKRLHAEWEDVNIENFYNYAFRYRNITFLVLDFVDRKKAPGHRGILHNDTFHSLQKWLNLSSAKGDPVIIFSHHPMVTPKLWCFPIWKYIAIRIATFEKEDLTKIEGLFRKTGARVLANFAGHVHGFYDPETIFAPIVRNPLFIEANKNYKLLGYTPAHIDVVTTEALMVASNEKKPKGIIRLVKIRDGSIDFDNVCANFTALNPYFKKIIRQGDTLEVEAYAFTKLFSAERPGKYTLYLDGVKAMEKTISKWWKPASFIVNCKAYRNITLEVKLKLPEGTIAENISRSIP